MRDFLPEDVRRREHVIDGDQGLPARGDLGRELRTDERIATSKQGCKGVAVALPDALLEVGAARFHLDHERPGRFEAGAQRGGHARGVDADQDAAAVERYAGALAVGQGRPQGRHGHAAGEPIGGKGGR